MHDTVELNITAFLNLMVILVPFLLITAVFSRMTVLELTLPQLNAQANPEEKINLDLQLAIYPSYLDIRDANLGSLKRFEVSSFDEFQWQPLIDLLVEIKSRYPEETSITLLLEKSVPYKTLIAAMDRVRSAEIVNVGTLEEVELFPDVSIGDAPAEVTVEEGADS